ncbi:MAG: HAD family hydrolase [Alphaproteobacteria bacterium]|nr:HAD family hydrolase [Alphaproteobacteria bacterium]
MRAWEARADTAVWDEPLYPAYLQETGQEHPSARDIKERYETDWRVVIEQMTGPPPGGCAVWYQKHIAHLYLPSMGARWLGAMRHFFLIRDPRAQLVSLAKKWPDVDLQRTGWPRLWEIYGLVCDETGEEPPVVDARDLQEDPARTLRLLCDALHVPFSEEMLGWSAGRRASDGAWAGHWYDAVEGSSGFKPWTPPREPVPERLTEVLEVCDRVYQALHARRLR